ncbi:MFS transporter [Jongsikchunia kroppenstedtii]|uniref:MFS transporter n=1 Tax=Jongsikchunia kroppenstedtii TaxID=1121721 RepID=UPI0005BA20E4|nr:MFS transporter [Jongsikchunia kroppenstedtii]
MNELSPQRKRIILATCCMSLLIVSMDATIVNVALPSIRRSFHADAADLQWVIDIYTLVLATLLMLSGALADRLGRRRVFQVGLTIFALGSLLCSIAPTVGVLIGARLVQAIGGSMLNPVAMSIITQVFTDVKERARAVGMWGAVVGISMAIGPIVGGWLVDTVGWRSVFWINLPICAAAIILTAIFVPESKSTTLRTLDPVGQLAFALFMAGAVFGLIEGPRNGWGTPMPVAAFTIAVVAMAVFIWYEHRVSDPFIDLRFFRSVPFSSATAIAVCAFSSYGAFLFMMSIYMQNQRGWSAIDAGLMYLPIAVAALVLSPLSGRLVGRYGTRPSLLCSSVLMTVGAVGLVLMKDDSPIWQLLITFFAFGAGFGMVNAPITTSAVGGMPRDRAGAASAVASTSRQLGVSIGVALCGAVAGRAVAGHGDFTDYARPLWWVTVALAVLIGLIGMASTTGWAQHTRESIGHLLAEPAGRPLVTAGSGGGRDA